MAKTSFTKKTLRLETVEPAVTPPSPNSNSTFAKKPKLATAKSKKREGNPDPFIATNATKTVRQCAPHRIEDHHNRVATAKSKQWIQMRQVSPHVSKDGSRSIGTLEYRNRGDRMVAFLRYSIVFLANEAPVWVERPIN